MSSRWIFIILMCIIGDVVYMDCFYSHMYCWRCCTHGLFLFSCVLLAPTTCLFPLGVCPQCQGGIHSKGYLFTSFPGVGICCSPHSLLWISVVYLISWYRYLLFTSFPGVDIWYSPHSLVWITVVHLIPWCGYLLFTSFSSVDEQWTENLSFHFIQSQKNMDRLFLMTLTRTM